MRAGTPPHPPPAQQTQGRDQSSRPPHIRSESTMRCSRRAASRGPVAVECSHFPCPALPLSRWGCLGPGQKPTRREHKATLTKASITFYLQTNQTASNLSFRQLGQQPKHTSLTCRPAASGSLFHETEHSCRQIDSGESTWEHSLLLRTLRKSAWRVTPGVTAAKSRQRPGSHQDSSTSPRGQVGEGGGKGRAASCGVCTGAGERTGRDPSTAQLGKSHHGEG